MTARRVRGTHRTPSKDDCPSDFANTPSLWAGPPCTIPVGRSRSAGSAGQTFAQRQPLAADPGPYAADHCNDRNEQEAQKHRVFDQRGAILVFAQAADESQGV